MAAVPVEQIEALLEEIRRRFEADYAANPVLAAIVEKAERGEATYADARRYASEVDRLSGRVTADFTLQSSQGVDPAFYRDNFREFHAALLPSVLDRNYQLIADYCEKVQKGLNEGAGLGLKAQRVWQDQDRVDGIVKHVTRAKDADQAARRAGADVEALDQHYVDRSIQVNADFQWKAGLKPKIVRIGGANCCEWCAEVEGTYDYPDVPKDVYRRHAYCTCSVEYDPADGRGQTQNVHDKSRWTDYAATEEKLRERQEFGLQENRERGIVERAMANGPRRGRLTFVNEQEQRLILQHADELGIPREVLSFNTGTRTSFNDKKGIINIRGDIFPSEYAANPSSILSERCALAHEYYGHFMSHPSKFAPNDWRDEFQASYRAAIDTPNLTFEERRMLMLDAFERARSAGVTVTYSTVARRYIYGTD